MKLADLARVVAVVAACAAAAASASSSQNKQGDPSQYPGNTPPQPTQMDPMAALGLWKSTFGAVKIEPDNQNGGIQQGNVQGVWSYDRQGKQVLGVFYGSLRGNVLQFHWQEPPPAPNAAPIGGDGYIVFDPSGRQYSGRWWSDHHDRAGDWNGWRQGMAQNQPPPYQGYPQGQGGGYPPPQGQGGYPPPQGGEPNGYPPPQGQQQPAPPAQPGQPTYY